jgi:hypothetical protein
MTQQKQKLTPELLKCMEFIKDAKSLEEARQCADYALKTYEERRRRIRVARALRAVKSIRLLETIVDREGQAVDYIWTPNSSLKEHQIEAIINAVLSTTGTTTDETQAT